MESQCYDYNSTKVTNIDSNTICIIPKSEFYKGFQENISFGVHV